VTRLTRQDLVNDPIAIRWLFFYYIVLILKKRLTRTIWSKPEIRTLNQAGSEKYAKKACYFMPKPYSVNDTIKKQVNTISF
jgi:hypothetical protein